MKSLTRIQSHLKKMEGGKKLCIRTIVPFGFAEGVQSGQEQLEILNWITDKLVQAGSYYMNDVFNIDPTMHAIYDSLEIIGTIYPLDLMSFYAEVVKTDGVDVTLKVSAARWEKCNYSVPVVTLAHALFTYVKKPGDEQQGSHIKK